MSGAASGPDGATATAFRRFLLLLDLRRRLVFRGPGRGVGARIFYSVMLLQFAVWAGLLTFGVYEMTSERPDLADNLVRATFLGVFTLQLMLGSMGVAVGEFYDTNRLLHLPVGPREIFAAMSVSALFAPGTLFVAGPIIGVLAASGDPAPIIAARAACFLAGIWFAHVCALTLGFVFLRFVSRRRFRDLATIAGSVVGVSIYLGFRALSGRDGKGDPTAWLSSPRFLDAQFLPSQWFAEAFLACGTDARRAAGFLALALAGAITAFLAGSAAFRAGYDAGGEVAHASEVVTDVKPGPARFLPYDIAAVVQATYAVFRREPQLRAMLLQQLVFFVLPVVMARGDRAGGGGGAALFIPLMIVLSHAALALSCFGVDGRGLGLLFASPISRRRLLLARLLALFGVFAVGDLLAAVGITVAVRAMRGDFAGAAPEAGALFGVTVLGDVALLACGAVASVVAPMVVIRTRRHAAPRVGREGCLVVLGRIMTLIPVALCTATAAGVALLPRLLKLDPLYYAVTVPAAAGVAVGLVAAGVSVGARLLEKREAEMLEALTDAGD
jgi:hypothetical protein